MSPCMLSTRSGICCPVESRSRHRAPQPSPGLDPVGPAETRTFQGRDRDSVEHPFKTGSPFQRAAARPGLNGEPRPGLRFIPPETVTQISYSPEAGPPLQHAAALPAADLPWSGLHKSAIRLRICADCAMIRLCIIIRICGVEGGAG